MLRVFLKNIHNFKFLKTASTIVSEIFEESHFKPLFFWKCGQLL